MVANTARLVSAFGRAPLRNLTGLWCILFAVLPVVATEFGLIPIYDSQRRVLPAYASFFCFLAFAYVFSLRHRLARAMFGGRLLTTEDSTHAGQPISINLLPACLILASLGGGVAYLWVFESGRGLPTFPALPRNAADAVVLALSFVAMFLLAEAAFAIMAVREYLQDVLGLTDAAVITGVRSGAEPGAHSESLAFSYKVVPPDSSNEEELSEFGSELANGAPGQTDRETQSRADVVSAKDKITSGSH
jgi:hypothetical protein